MNFRRQIAAGALSGALTLALLTGCTAPQESQDSAAAGQGTAGKNPVAVTVWHYYNGAQLQSFEALVTEFNETVGAQEGVVVDAHSYGNVGELTEKVTDAIHKEVGAEGVPDVFAAYADTAYAINQLGRAAELSQYLTKEEQEAYVASYLEEGRFGAEGFQIFPVAKSTEILALNQTEWDRFAAATGAKTDALATWEGIAGLAEEYYTWTDGLTPGVPDDGKAFFGRDAFANYIIIGSYQMGQEIFQVEDGKVTLNVDHGVMRRLWDNYYVPFISGYYAAYGNFRSDDLRTGAVMAYVGSTSAATFFPTAVTDESGNETPIEGAVYPVPSFQGAQPVAVQQGAGMVVTKSTVERERAAVTFLKWFTQPEQNIRFAVSSGYLPVTYAANDQKTISQVLVQAGDSAAPVLQESLRCGAKMTQEYTLYTNRPFEHGYDARQVCENSMQDQAKNDRAAVLELMAGGMSRAEAVAQYNTGEHFEAWLTQFKNDLAASVAGA